ncbi:MAG: hypothetical protein LVS60_07915 [Nodosilinea sp. LVE1205-7]
MNFKAIHSYYRFTGLTAICLFTIGTGLTSPAHAANFSFSEVQAGDPGRNNTAATADATNIVLPAFNDAVSIDGTLATAGDEDWFSFTINQTGTLAVSFTSASFPPPGEPKPTLEGFLYLAGTTPTLLQSLSFQPPGGNGSLVPGSYSAGSLFLVQVLGTGAYPRNYNYKAELQAAPPPPPPGSRTHSSPTTWLDWHGCGGLA